MLSAPLHVLCVLLFILALNVELTPISSWNRPSRFFARNLFDAGRQKSYVDFMLKSLLKPSLLSCVRGINVLLANSVMTSMAERPRTGVNSLEDWSNKWREGVTGWHLKEVNPLLIKHFDLLTDGRQNVSAFVPLCGKSVDLKWIHERGETFDLIRSIGLLP